jgi:hypothetical protein
MSHELDDGVLSARFAAHAEAGLKRVQLEIAGEQVVLFLRKGQLHGQCTCGAQPCDHLETALHFLGERPSLVPSDPRARSSLRPPAPAGGPDLAPVAEAFDELRLAVARAGSSAPDSPAIRDALEQLVQRAGTPVPLGLSRWIARLLEALALRETGQVARLLDGTRQLADDIVSGERGSAAQLRKRAWLGLSEGPVHDSLTDATLLEIARERLAGVSRVAIERRYLVDLSSGEIFKEERRVGDQEMSVGPCPRVVHVAFAEVESGALPRRVRLLQYTVSAQPSAEQWARIKDHALHNVRELSARFAAGQKAAPGLAEPFVLLAPRTLSSAPDARLRDANGDAVQLSDETPAADALRAASADGELVWVAGRLLGLSRGLVMRPASALVRRADGLHLNRIT